jgi:hypothetical protein
MSPGFLDARAELEAGGLTVKPSGETSLWIRDRMQEAGGIRFSNDASVLLRQGDRWIAVFPAEGMLSYEVPGDLPDLVVLIKGAYASDRRLGGRLNDAFARSVPDPEPYPLRPTPGGGPADSRVAHPTSAGRGRLRG